MTTNAIADAEAMGMLDANELYQLVRAAPSQGVRQVMTGIVDGRVLNAVANHLLSDAKTAGYNINKYEEGPALLE